MKCALTTLLCVALYGPAPASADVQPIPVRLVIAGEAARVEGAEPDRVTFELRNEGEVSMRLYLHHLVLREGTEHRIPIARVERDGRASRRVVTIPAASSRRFTVFFELPAALRGRSRWELELRVTFGSFPIGEHQPARLTRADARQKLARGRPMR